MDAVLDASFSKMPTMASDDAAVSAENFVADGVFSLPQIENVSVFQLFHPSDRTLASPIYTMALNTSNTPMLWAWSQQQSLNLIIHSPFRTLGAFCQCTKHNSMFCIVFPLFLFQVSHNCIPLRVTSYTANKLLISRPQRTQTCQRYHHTWFRVLQRYHHRCRLPCFHGPIHQFSNSQKSN